MQTAKSTSLTDAFIGYVKKAENPDRAGFDRAKGRWFPHKDPAGGHAIGYGHRLTPQETSQFARSGATEHQVEDMLVGDLMLARQNVHRYIHQKYGAQIQLHPRQEQMLMDYAFNLGSIANFPKMVRAVLDWDVQTMWREYPRYAKIGGRMTQLTGRNKLFADTFLPPQKSSKIPNS